MKEFLERYRELGFSFIPIKPRDKRPMIPVWMPYMSRLPTREEEAHWFNVDSPPNIGIVTGNVSNLAVLDFDDAESYYSFFEKLNINTMIASTGKGYHYYFRPDIHAKTTTFKLNGGLHHVKQEGGYVVAPPSIHPSGRKYEFINGLEPAFISLETIFRILESIGAAKHISEIKERPATWASDLCTTLTTGERNQRAAQMAGLLVRKFAYDPGLIEGLMHAWNQTYCDPPLGEAPGDDRDELINLVRGEYQRYGPRS